MDAAQEEVRGRRRSLILRDALAFLGLVLITVALFAVTLFLFRSFSAHRLEMAQRWYARGTAALAAGRASDAVGALQTALSYAPAERDYQLSLAEALEQAGKTDEAFAYFSNLWEAEPGDGLLNLQLARLSVKKQEEEEQRLASEGQKKGILRRGNLAGTNQEAQAQSDAVRYYHASIYGTWEGNGVERRRDVRLELVRYLLAHKNPGAARNELLIAAGNYGDDPALEMTAAPLMAEAGDASSALEIYERVLKMKPEDLAALEGAAETASTIGRYATAQRYAKKARKVAEANEDRAAMAKMSAVLGQAERILELVPSENLTDEERIGRILRARTLAENRLNGCYAQFATLGKVPGALQQLEDKWREDAKAPAVAPARQDRELELRAAQVRALEDAMRRNDARQRSEMEMIFSTETALNDICGAPAGDDALLEVIAKNLEQVTQ